MATTHYIDASYLPLVLVARRIPTIEAHWCVMSAGVIGPPTECRRWREEGPLSATRSIAQPMTSGYLYRTVNRVESQGAREVRKTWRIGIRALRRSQQSLYLVPRHAQP